MAVQELAEKLNVSIQEWLKGHDKLVVAIDGHTGSGKTTLLNELLKLNSDVVPVSRDDFQISREEFRKLYDKTEDRSSLFELEMNDSAKLKKLVETYRQSNEPYEMMAYDGTTGRIDIPKVYDFSKKVMVIEGIFMLHPKLLGGLWDRSVYLRGDFDKIKERRVAREKDRWGEKYFPEDHPDSYFRQVIIALNRYESTYHPENLADLVLSVD